MSEKRGGSATVPGVGARLSGRSVIRSQGGHDYLIMSEGCSLDLLEELARIHGIRLMRAPPGPPPARIVRVQTGRRTS